MLVADFLKKEWKYLAGLLVVLLIIGIGYYEYKASKALPMATVQTVDYESIAKAMATIKPNATPAEVRTITEKITEVKQSPPQIVYVTQDQKAADVKANNLAKKDKGDLVIKETTTPVTNSFYSVHTEKNTKIKAGVTVLPKDAYIDLGLQKGKNEVIVHYAPVSNDYGVSYERTLIEW
jgi:hypothetical protein